MKNRSIAILIGLLTISYSCSNDLELLAPYEELPSLMCILNPDDSIHYLRLERGFSGPKNALEMAREADSIYYSQADIVLKEFDGKELKSELFIEEIEYLEKDAGLFNESGHRVYRFNKTLNHNYHYQLEAYLPKPDLSISANTNLVQGIKIVKPPNTQPSLSFSRYDDFTELEWRTTPHSRIFLVQFRFNFLEAYGGDTTLHHVIWPIAHYTTNHAEGGEKLEARISHQSFFTWLASKLEPTNKSIKRIVPKKTIDILFTMGGDDLYTYLQVLNPDNASMTPRPAYSNVENGIGIFSSRRTREILGKAFSYATIDSIALGEATKHLGFVDTTDDYYRW